MTKVFFLNRFEKRFLEALPESLTFSKANHKGIPILGATPAKVAHIASIPTEVVIPTVNTLIEKGLVMWGQKGSNRIMHAVTDGEPYELVEWDNG